MKICLVTHTFPRYPFDNAAPFMDGLARGLVASGNEVIVLTPFSSAPFKWKNLPYEIVTYKYIYPNRFHTLGYSQTLKNDMKLKMSVYLASPFLIFFGLLKLLFLIKKEKIDVINAHWILPNGFIGAVASLITGVPLITTLPGSDVYMTRSNVLFQEMAKVATKRSNVITSNSEQLLKDLEKNLKLRFSKSVIVYGVDTEQFKPEDSSEILKIKLDLRKTDIVVVGVGRLVAKKGFSYLIDAIPEIIKKFGNIKFVIVGEGDERKLLELKILDLKIENFVKLVGAKSYKELKDYYNLADIFILPSIRDEKGNLDDQSVAVSEAMSCGKPVITTDFPGYRVVVSDETGFLIPEKNIKEISRTILILANDSKRRKKMGIAGRKRIERFFSWSVIGERYIDLFKNILNNKSK